MEGSGQLHAPVA